MDMAAVYLNTTAIKTNDDYPVTSSDTVSSPFVVSDDLLLIFQWVVFVVICQIIDVFGTVTNIINIICFIEQGFQDTINISLMGNVVYVFINL